MPQRLVRYRLFQTTGVPRFQTTEGAGICWQRHCLRKCVPSEKRLLLKGFYVWKSCMILVALLEDTNYGKSSIIAISRWHVLDLTLQEIRYTFLHTFIFTMQICTSVRPLWNNQKKYSLATIGLNFQMLLSRTS